VSLSSIFGNNGNEQVTEWSRLNDSTLRIDQRHS